jgi:hypothetical protein
MVGRHQRRMPTLAWSRRGRLPSRRRLCAQLSALLSRPMPSFIHESFVAFFYSHLAPQLGNAASRMDPALTWRATGSPTIQLRIGKVWIGKQADASLKIIDAESRDTGAVPSLQVEVGYAEKWEDLVRDGKNWLLGSDTVCSVLIVKFSAPKRRTDRPNPKKWSGVISVCRRASSG